MSHCNTYEDILEDNLRINLNAYNLHNLNI